MRLQFDFFFVPFTLYGKNGLKIFHFRIPISRVLKKITKIKKKFYKIRTIKKQENQEICQEKNLENQKKSGKKI